MEADLDDLDDLDDLETMALIRAFDERAIALWREGVVRGSVHPYIGQEAIAVGVCRALTRADIVASYHRGHGHCIAKGADVPAMMMELLGRAGGTCGGKGGSMHIADFSVGVLGSNGVVGDGVTLALGAAHSIRLRGEDHIAVAFFGDGAINRGPVMEAMNWAAMARLPLLFVCENNRYSATTATGSVTAPAGIQARVEGFGLPLEVVDGNDLEAVRRAARRLVETVRRSGPAFLLAETYRARGHLASDAAAYRPAGEAEAAWRTEPIGRFAATLLSRGVPKDHVDARLRRAEARIDEAEARARAAPWPEPAALFSDVQDVGAVEWLA